MQEGFNSLRSEIDKSADNVIKANELVAESNDAVYYLAERVREMEEEMTMMGMQIKKLHAMTAAYVPIKGDEVDQALADFLNNFYDRGKIQVMFVRLSPGIYSFGSKKVCIKVDNGKINIRIGGGYLRIDEFLEKYTTVELEKSIRDGVDPMTGTQVTKMGKMLQ